MDIEKKRAIFALGTIAAIILAITGYYVWANYINKGIVRIYSDAPFLVDEFLKESYPCPESPCEIKLKAGERSLSIAKEGYETAVEEVIVIRGEAVDLRVALGVNPYVIKTDEYPDVEAKTDYEIVFDSSNSYYKLIDNGDPLREAIAYFRTEIGSPKIYGSAHSILVIDQKAADFTAYIIDTDKDERIRVTDSRIGNVKNGQWSFTGNYFVFSTSDSEALWLMTDAGKVMETELTSDVRQTAWTDLDTLVYIMQEEDDYYSVGVYSTTTDFYSKIEDLTMITQTPRNVISLANGAAVYFQVGKDNYKIILK